MEVLDSLIIRCARSAAVPAGGALAVDRQRFAALVEKELNDHPNVVLTRAEQTCLPLQPAIIATGPLTSPELHSALEEALGEGALSFFDAVAPIVTSDSLDHRQLFRASRYGKGGGDDYLNAALTREQYEAFVEAVLAGEHVAFRDFESQDIRYFEGCLPIEVMAQRGIETLRHGPMKPTGLTDPSTGRWPWAVVQLRQDDLTAEHWNLVGFQTKLTRGAQQRIFRSIPGMENAKFVRYGMIHRNTFVNAPLHLDESLRLKNRPNLRLAGQMTGVEGYVESAATGLIAARAFIQEKRGHAVIPPPPGTAHHGLIRHLTARQARGFQPSNVTWGLMACPQELAVVRNKKERRERQATTALSLISHWHEQTRR
jgi:methylenetetrahydrofolate--tRNA-(uracil-5-)-methyltransferase